MKEIDEGTQIAKIRSYEKGFFATHLINIGWKSGIFEALKEAEEGMTVPDLALKLGLHEPYLKILCQTAYNYEILDCDSQDRFKFQPFLDKILGDKSYPRNRSVAIHIYADFVGKELPDVPEYLRTGGTVEDPYTPELSEAVFELTKAVHLAFLFIVIQGNNHLKQKLEQGVKFLDVGCGSGNLIVQLAQSFKNSTFMGIDPDSNGIERANNIISQSGLKERVSVENMGGQELDHEDEFDLVSMAISFHEIPPDVREQTVKKVHGALKSSGQMLILDFPYPGELEDFRNPMYDMGVQDQFYEAFAGVVHLNMDEKKELLTKVGFQNVQRTDVVEGILELITATK